MKYFTARISARPDDPGPTVRQQTYLRALAAQPEIEIFYGHFLSHPVSALNLEPPPKWVKFLKTEEKGSDVNIATQLLCDAYERRFDVDAVVSSDSDLVMPIEVVTHRLGLPVGVLSPRDPIPVKLREVATFVRVIRYGVLAASQLPTTLTDSAGTVHKPRAW